MIQRQNNYIETISRETYEIVCSNYMKAKNKPTMRLSNKACNSIREKFGNDAVITAFGVIKSSENTAKGVKASVGWSKDKTYQEYKDGGCYEHIYL